jgi:hypothetical protein
MRCYHRKRCDNAASILRDGSVDAVGTYMTTECSRVCGFPMPRAAVTAGGQADP